MGLLDDRMIMIMIVFDRLGRMRKKTSGCRVFRNIQDKVPDFRNIQDKVPDF